MTENQLAEPVQLKLRVRGDTRRQLEEAAEANGWTLNREVIERLEMSLRGESLFGGRKTTAFMRLLAGVIEMVEAENGEAWTSDPSSFQQVREAIVTLIDRLDPSADRDEDTELSRAQDAVRRAQKMAHVSEHALRDYLADRFGDDVLEVTGDRSRVGRLRSKKPVDVRIADLIREANLRAASELTSAQTVEFQARMGRLVASCEAKLNAVGAALKTWREVVDRRRMRIEQQVLVGQSLALRMLGIDVPSNSETE